MFILNDATATGEVDEALLDKKLVLGVGKHREDQNFIPVTHTVGDLIEHLSRFEVGKKDGACVLQGSTVGGRRLATAMQANYTLMVDLDYGITVDEVRARVERLGLFALIYTTHSSGRNETEVAEKALTAWCRKRGVVLGYDDTEIEASARSYLSLEKNYTDAVLAECVLVERRHTESGVAYVIRHGALPKMRVLFVLDQPWSFIDGGPTKTASQAERIDGWKTAYTTFAGAALNVKFDKACTDPSRLFYTPRIGKAKTDADVILVVPGAALKLEDYAQAAKLVDRFAYDGKSKGLVSKSRETQTGSQTGSQTPGLKAFVAKYPDFDAVSWLRDVAPDDERGGKTTSEGAHWTCPREDQHTVVSLEDTAFAVFSSPDRGWGMFCHHAGCVDASGDDRLWFLDALMVKYGCGVDDLRGYSEMARREEDVRIEAKLLASAPDKLDDVIAGLTEETTDEVVGTALLAVNDLPALARTRGLARVSRAVGVPVSKLEKMIKGLKKEPVVEGSRRREVPADLAKADKIWLDWDWDIQVKATIARLHALNEVNPRLFRRAEGGVVRVEDAVNGRMIVTPVGPAQWLAILGECCTYVAEIDGEVIGQSPPKAMATHMMGTTLLQFPELSTVSRVALFDENDQLRTEKGYNAGLKVYLDPIYDPLPVSSKPTEDEVLDAVDLLLEAIRDFPFADYDEPDKPIKLDDVDADNFRLPNLDRGEASRANAIAMILQPFVRNLIKGATPSYHIDKSSPGTGAGYLVDVAHIIAEGCAAEIQTMSASNEEFRKNITATLRGGASIIFVDNINRHVDSGDLAAALTSGVWRDRILGKTETVTIPVKSMWVMAGNNVSFSHELMRRNVPIYMDAGISNPALNRGKNDFKHFPLQPWLIENRAKLIWACHTLIANWISAGKPAGAGLINSFDSWSSVMSGVLETAGISGFLNNVRQYLEAKDDDGSALDSAAQLIASRFGTDEWSIQEAMLALRNPVTGDWLVELPIMGESDEGKMKSFGRWATKNLVDVNFTLDASEPYPAQHRFVADASGVYRVKCHKRRVRTGLKYRFVPRRQI